MVWPWVIDPFLLFFCDVYMHFNEEKKNSAYVKFHIGWGIFPPPPGLHLYSEVKTEFPRCWSLVIPWFRYIDDTFILIPSDLHHFNLISLVNSVDHWIQFIFTKSKGQFPSFLWYFDFNSENGCLPLFSPLMFFKPSSSTENGVLLYFCF